MQYWPQNPQYFRQLSWAHCPYCWHALDWKDEHVMFGLSSQGGGGVCMTAESTKVVLQFRNVMEMTRAWGRIQIVCLIKLNQQHKILIKVIKLMNVNTYEYKCYKNVGSSLLPIWRIHQYMIPCRIVDSCLVCLDMDRCSG